MFHRITGDDRGLDLEGVALFSHLSARDLREVARFTTRVRFSTGAELCREGQIGREAFVILSGTAQVIRDGEIVTTLGRGDLVGEQALLGRGRRNATVIATSPLETAVMSPREFVSLMALPGVADTVRQVADNRLLASSPAA